MSFFILSDIFLTLDVFLSATPKRWKESIGFQDAELQAESFEKYIYIYIKKLNIQEAYETLKIISEVISSDIISFQFPDTSE